MVCKQNHRNLIVKKVLLFAGCNSWTINWADDKIDDGHTINVWKL